MKKKVVLSVLASVFMYLSHASSAFGLQGGMGVPCGSGGRAFTNLGAQPITFDLSVSAGFIGNGAPCPVTFSWTDTQGHPQSITATEAASSLGVSSSLPAGGVISFSIASGTSDTWNIFWRLERPPATPGGLHFDMSVTFGNSVGSLGLGGLSTNAQQNCGSTSTTFYTNLTSGLIRFDLSVTAGYGSCPVTISWSDAGGHSQTITLTPGISQGVSTSLPAGGTISWASSPGPGTIGLQWELERAVILPNHNS